jgi:hypothetical protein
VGKVPVILAVGPQEVEDGTVSVRRLGETQREGKVMRYWSFEKGFGYDNLVLHEAETPRPGPRDVLLEMRAASLNYRDLVVLRGQHGRRVQPPLDPAVRRGGHRGRDRRGRRPTSSPGDRVAPVFFQNWEGGPRRPRTSRPGGSAARCDGVLATHPSSPRAASCACPST